MFETEVAHDKWIDLCVVYVVHNFVKCTMQFESIPLFLGATPLGAVGHGLVVAIF